MKLKKFRVENYCSIIDSGIVELSDIDNVSVFAGQNESGKSSLLRALYDFEQGKFEPDSMPFSTGQKPTQVVSCTYKIEQSDDIAEILSSIVIDDRKLEIKEGQKILDENKLRKIREFTITKTDENGEVKTALDDNSFKIFQAAILDKPKEIKEGEETKTDEGEEIKEKYIDITDEQNSDVAGLFWQAGPKIVFFDDFCDLLPNKIFVSALKEEKTDTEGLSCRSKFRTNTRYGFC